MSASENAVQDKRGQERVEVSEIIRVVDQQTGCDIGRLVNISQEGIMILGSHPIPESSILQITLEFEADTDDEEPIQIGVESLWCRSSKDESNYWSGFYIIDISDRNRERVESLINKQ
jgi:hypothetical protein